MSEMRMYEQLGRAIAKRRADLGLTQLDVAQKIGLARASLANVESGRQRILVHQLYRLAEALELKSITDLVPSTWHFDEEEEAPRLEMKLDANAAKTDATSKLTDAQQAGLQNIIRQALGPAKGRKKQ